VPKGANEVVGVEFAGTVERVGPAPAEGHDGAEATVLRAAIGRWKEGDEVFGLAYGVRAFPHLFLDVADRLSCLQGAYSEYIVSPATHLLPKPASLSFVDAASIPEVWLTGAFRLFSLPLAMSDACMQRTRR
jgi:NADPH:quinone reductase-like Zn-dependent oxidoreductase